MLCCEIHTFVAISLCSGGRWKLLCKCSFLTRASLDHRPITVPVHSHVQISGVVTGGDGMCLLANSQRHSSRDEYVFSVTVPRKDVVSEEVKVRCQALMFGAKTSLCIVVDYDIIKLLATVWRFTVILTFTRTEKRYWHTSMSNLSSNTALKIKTCDFVTCNKSS